MRDRNNKPDEIWVTLEHYGVDTSGIKIYPCDGNVVMYSNPI